MSVIYTAALGDSSGYAEAARNYVGALHHVGIQVGTRSVSFESWKTDHGSLGTLCQSLSGRYLDAPKQIIHATPNIFRKLMDTSKYNIGLTVWETSKLPETWVPEINLMDEVWVPCSWNKEVFENSGVTKPIRVVPHCFTEPPKPEHMVIDNINPNDYVFYSIFQWTERKNPFGLLKAFLTEFKNTENVVLVLKTYIINPTSTTEADKIKTMIREFKASMYLKTPPRIILITHSLSKGQMSALHTRGDCFVSLHRAEGFGMPIAEAMLFEKPVITTRYGGPIDFINSETGFLVPCDETPVSGMPWETYTGEQLWAEPKIMDARFFMRKVFNDREHGQRLGKAAKTSILTNFSYEKVGNLMKEIL